MQNISFVLHGNNSPIKWFPSTEKLQHDNSKAVDITFQSVLTRQGNFWCIVSRSNILVQYLNVPDKVTTSVSLMSMGKRKSHFFKEDKHSCWSLKQPQRTSNGISHMQIFFSVLVNTLLTVWSLNPWVHTVYIFRLRKLAQRRTLLDN